MRAHTVGEQALGRAVPARGDVLREGVPAVHAAAAAKVRQLQVLAGDQDVLRLDVPACSTSMLRRILEGMGSLAPITF